MSVGRIAIVVRPTTPSDGERPELPPMLIGHATTEVRRRVEKFYASVAELFEAWVARRCRPGSWDSRPGRKGFRRRTRRDRRSAKWLPLSNVLAAGTFFLPREEYKNPATRAVYSKHGWQFNVDTAVRVLFVGIRKTRSECALGYGARAPSTAIRSALHVRTGPFHAPLGPRWACIAVRILIR